MSLLQTQIDLKDLRTALRLFVKWWSDELRSLVPMRARRLLGADPRRLSIAITEAGFAMRVGTPDADGSSSALPAVTHADWDSLLGRLKAEKRRWRGLLTVAVRVPLAWCLVRDRMLPARALDQAEAFLRLDLQHATPLPLEEVHWGWFAAIPSTSDTVMVRQLVIKRSRIDALLQALSQNGLAPIAIEVEGEEGRLLPVNLMPGGQRLSPFEARLRKTLMVSATMLALLTVLAAGMAINRQQQLLGELGTEQERLIRKASDVRQRLSGAEAAFTQARQVRLHKSQSTTFVQIWEELTRLLPDTTWVTDLRLDGGTLAIDGYAASASELIGELAGSRLWKEVAFSSPVTREAQRPVERFQIRMVLERTGVQSATQMKKQP